MKTRNQKLKQVAKQLERDGCQLKALGNASSQTLLKLYVSLVRPHLEYACLVWDPHLSKDIGMLESVQTFALKICTGQWHSSYEDFLNSANLPSLKFRRLYLRLAMLYKIQNDRSFFPPNHLIGRHSTVRFDREQLLLQPFARTNQYFNSFLPRTIGDWNKLPPELVNATSMTEFKRTWLDAEPVLLEQFNLT